MNSPGTWQGIGTRSIEIRQENGETISAKKSPRYVKMSHGFIDCDLVQSITDAVTCYDTGFVRCLYFSGQSCARWSL